MTNSRDRGREGGRRACAGSAELWLQEWPRGRGTAQAPAATPDDVAEAFRSGGYARAAVREVRAGTDAAAAARDVFRDARDGVRPGDVAVVELGSGRRAFVMTRTGRDSSPVEIDLGRRPRPAT